MRKFSIVLSIIMAAIMLGACAGNVPGTNVPNSSPIATNVISTPSVEATTTTSETTVPQETEGATAVVPVTGKPNASRLSEQLTFTVLNQNGQQIGEVEDMILNLDNAMVDYVIVRTAEKQVAVPWDKLSVQTDAAAGQERLLSRWTIRRLQWHQPWTLTPYLPLLNLPTTGTLNSGHIGKEIMQAGLSRHLAQPTRANCEA